MQSKYYPSIGETLYSHTLPNGLELRVVPKSGFSSCYAVFAAHYGGAHRRFELDGKLLDTPAGVAHFLEHKMFDMPDGDNALNVLSANGADPNAFTSSDSTCYYFSCTGGFEENLRMLLRFVSTPYFTPETVSKEQGIIAQEILMGDDSPGTAVYYNLLELLYASHPIRDKVAGTVESISHITDQVLYDCHRAFYTPGNMCLCVEGDVDPERVLEIALEELPKESGPVPRADFGPEEGLLPIAARHTAAMAVSAPQYLIGAKLPPPPGGDAQRQRIIARRALRQLVGRASSFYSRLYSQGLITRDFDYEADFAAGTGTVIIGGESRDPERVLSELNAEIARVNAQGLDPERFERAKRAAIGSRLAGMEDFENVCISLALSLFDGYCSFDDQEILENITKAECEAFIRENLSPERLAMSVIVPAGESGE